MKKWLKTPVSTNQPATRSDFTTHPNNDWDWEFVFEQWCLNSTQNVTDVGRIATHLNETTDDAPILRTVFAAFSTAGRLNICRTDLIFDESRHVSTTLWFVVRQLRVRIKRLSCTGNRLQLAIESRPNDLFRPLNSSYIEVSPIEPSHSVAH